MSQQVSTSPLFVAIVCYQSHVTGKKIQFCLQHFEFRLRMKSSSREVTEADLHSSQDLSDKLLQESMQGCWVFEMDDLRWIKEDSHRPWLYEC